MNIILRTDKKATDLASFLHGACFSPSKDTFIKAINNNFFITWPGLTSKLISKHLLPSTATHSGHLRQEKQGLRSTKSLSPTAVAANISQANDDFFP